MKIILQGGFIVLIIAICMEVFAYFSELNFISGKYDIIILYYVVINSLCLEKIIEKNAKN